MSMDKVIRWLLDGDVSMQYQTRRTLLQEDETALAALRRRMETEGFAARLLACRNTDGHWGLHYYQPKWTSTHYTLLDLKNLGLSPAVNACRVMAARALADCMLPNGGMNLSKYDHPSDMGVSGMVMGYAAYFVRDDPHIQRLLKYILAHQKTDGGFHWNEASQTGEPHTTQCVLEGLGEYLATGAKHRRAETERAAADGAEFLLRNRLFMQDKRFGKLSYPYRYRYDLLRALEFFAARGIPCDNRMLPAVKWLEGKRRPDGRWVLENVHKGKAHFDMEKQGEPSRWITLKALRILSRFGQAPGKGKADELQS